MDAKARMQIVNDIFADISEKLGRLTTQGVITVKEGVDLINTISKKQYEWMINNFTPDEIDNFIRNI